MEKEQMKTLEEKGEAIVETVENVRAKHREMEEKLRDLLRIALHYIRGIDPQDIDRDRSYTVNGLATITMKDGNVYHIPVKELEP
jgi:hypothetical protein